ncbi:MAG: porphobilinogen synthase [Pseudomonadota bacterium]
MPFPLTRPRRIRAHQWSRRLHAETKVSVSDLIWPLFLIEGTGAEEPIAAMPGVNRLTIDKAVDAAKRAAALGIPALALFPNTPADRRSDDGVEALNEDNLICRALKAIKDAVPEIGLAADVALDPYTAHGHDGLMRDGYIVNDETVEVLVQQALTQARAGADILSPSDMMDGRILHIREALEGNGFVNVQLMSYAAKYASAFYGPFRDAVGSGSRLTGDKRTYQMDAANSDEAVREAALDLEEGADSLIVKPGLPYLDIVARLKTELETPVFVYHVSGEYSKIVAAAERGWLDRKAAALEHMQAFKRAGADGVLTYFAPEIAEWLNGA